MGRIFLGVRRRGRPLVLAFGCALGLAAVLAPASALAAKHRVTHRRVVHIHRFGELDCNGFSRRQHVIKRTIPCADIAGKRGVSNDWVWNNRFHDNGHYIGHDEPDMTFLSSAAGSGNDVSWTETLPRDPSALPTVAHPGSDVTHWFELSPAPWFSMAQCDPNSYPQLPCEPKADMNAPSGRYPGAGGAFMELQFYPPGFAPIWTDGISCDNTHWCAAMTIDSLECTLGFVHCNPACIEPVNFALISTNGTPAGPPSPQMANQATFTPNNKTLLMNQGDRVSVHMFDAAVPGGSGQNAFKAVVTDLTTGQTGSMQASAKNGFQNTSIVDCSGAPFNFEPEYNTAKKTNITPWAALQTNISTQYEIGHFEPCTSITDTGVFQYNSRTLPDTYWKNCHSPYETTTAPDGGSNAEAGDAPCFPFGYTHGAAHTPPDQVTGCVQFFDQNGDLDFDGNAYWADWPTGTSPTSTFASTFVQDPPITTGRTYPQFFIQTDAALSESTCTASGEGCAVPPPNAPG
ncbi:MAG: hypothetical protein QOG59_2512, partial [Solirubrobacteraceae bacterium]|nr:hypothetical protein [Solirubrobacteraceae bacterium]